VAEEADEIAVVLKALELRALDQQPALRSLEDLAQCTMSEARATNHTWRALSEYVGGPFPIDSEARSQPSRRLLTREQPQLWEATLERARTILSQDGRIDWRSVRVDVADQIDVADVFAALSIGALAAAAPSLGSRGGLIQDAFANIQSSADKHNLPDLIQSLFGADTPAPFMDVGARGVYHRFAHGHDLLWALPQGVRELGLFRGVIGVFQHLLRDSFGRTGIPLPGSTLFADAVTQHFEGQGLDAIISPKHLSRFAGVRIVDGVSTGATSLLLWLYGQVRGIPTGSFRSARIAILAHGLCFVGVAIAALIPGLRANLPYRSHLNYISLTSLLYNAVQLQRLTAALTRENREQQAQLLQTLDTLRDAREGLLEAEELNRRLREVSEAAVRPVEGAA